MASVTSRHRLCVWSNNQVYYAHAARRLMMSQVRCSAHAPHVSVLLLTTAPVASHSGFIYHSLSAIITYSH